MPTAKKTAKKNGFWKEKIETKKGERFGKLVALQPGPAYMTPGTGEVYERWIYECDCGNRVNWKPSQVRSNARKGWCSCPECFHRAQGDGTIPKSEKQIEREREEERERERDQMLEAIAEGRWCRGELILR